jgi:hypothetical protein
VFKVHVDDDCIFLFFGFRVILVKLSFLDLTFTWIAFLLSIHL